MLWEADDLIDPEAAAAPEQADLRTAFDASPFGAKVPLTVEHEVAVAVGGRLVRGRIDAVYEIAGEHWIVDWKTGARGSADPLQLALYRLAWAAERGVPVEQVVGCFVQVRQHRYSVYRNLPGADDLAAVLGGGPARLSPTSTHTWEV